MAKYLDLSGLETLWGHITSKLSTKADKNGSNATGTWGISISGSSASCTGNAATATKDGNGNTITSTYATKNELNDVSTLVGDTAVSTQITNAITTAIDGLNIQNGSRTGSLRSVGSYAENDSYTIGSYATAFGQTTKASGGFSHAEGRNTTASGSASHAEGQMTIASGSASHAEGRSTKANGAYSHVEGWYTTANGDYSHAEGYETYAIGDYSHAEGYQTYANSNYSHAEGYQTYANSSDCQHVQGKYNISDQSGHYAHIVGNGTSLSDRSNAHTLDWDGNAWFQGSVYVGGTGQTDTAAVKLITQTDMETYVNESILGGAW